MKRFFALLAGILLLVSLFVTQPVHAADGSNNVTSLPQINISAPTYPVGITSREIKFVPFAFEETANVSGFITSRSFQFYTQYGVPLTGMRGPYRTQIQVNALQTTDWSELVYLPQSVLRKARAMNEYAIILKTTFYGKTTSGTNFSAQSALLLLFPPDAFSKVSPTSGATDQPTNTSLHWSSSVGAIDYEYCFDTIDNNRCDTDWTGTYWLGTYDTNAALQNLPSGATFYWQVRANNTAGTTYANDGTWWSFTTACNNNQITVTTTDDSGAGSLRQAIADLCPGGTINFADSLSGQTITLASSLLIAKDLTIDATSLAARLSISGNNNVTVFNVLAKVTAEIKNLKITNGKSNESGGGIYNSGHLTLTSVELSQNAATTSGGAIFNRKSGALNVTNSTLTSNRADQGGGIFNNGTLTITNSTFTSNGNGAMYSSEGTVTITNSTISKNSGSYAVVNDNADVTIVNSILYGDSGGEINNLGTTATVTYSIVQGDYVGIGNRNVDPLLGDLADNGGPTQTMALSSQSPAIDAGNNASCPATDQRGVTRPQGTACDLGAYEVEIAQVDVNIAAETKATYFLLPGDSIRNSYVSTDAGPMEVKSINDLPILSSQEFIFSYQNSKSYAALMGYPGDQLATEYWFPWYNNLSYSTQLRVSNIGSGSAEVKVYAGSSATPIDTFTLSAGEAARKSYQIDNGPLHVISADGVTPILASERFIQTFKSSASYSEMMGYPGDQLATEYWFPWYNNLNYSTQLRVGNLGNISAEVKVYAGNSTIPIDTFTLQAGEGFRKSYLVDNGPLHVVSTDGVTPILASERFIQTFKNSASYAEMMGYPADQLDTEYCFPWYNNTSEGLLTLSTQLRISNITNSDTTQAIKVYLAGTEVDSFDLKAGEGKRVSYSNQNDGPLCVVSATPILVSERFISTYLNSASYSEMMGYPTDRLASSYWFPWYNNISYSTQLRIAKPQLP